jgi:cobalt/nickel transport protein
MKKNGKWILILVLTVAAVTALPLFLNSLDFTGADDAAGKSVAAVDPGYKPWAKPVIEFAGKNTETLLFCLQAGIGAGVLGLGFGYLVLRKKNQKG